MKRLAPYTLLQYILFATAASGINPNFCFYYWPLFLDACVDLSLTRNGMYYWQPYDINNCMHPTGMFSRGMCYPGIYLPSTGEFRPHQPALPARAASSCGRHYNGPGYATTCNYTCTPPLDTIPRTYNYPDGTPCLNINKKQQPLGLAGICVDGACIQYDDDRLHIDGWNSTIEAMVFSPDKYGCKDKAYFGKRAVFDCRTYCNTDGGWLYGSYASDTTCQFLDQDRLGWCCNGTCHSKSGCQM